MKKVEISGPVHQTEKTDLSEEDEDEQMAKARMRSCVLEKRKTREDNEAVSTTKLDPRHTSNPLARL